MSYIFEGGRLGHLRTRNLLIINDDVCCSVLILRARWDEMPGQAGHDRLKSSSPFGYAQGKLCFAPQDDAMDAQKQYMKVQ